jgi:predicted Fe-Mo cluster-binding NifX family protein
MKMCITSTGATLDASVDPRFGRCQYFVIVDPETMEFEAIPNYSIGASSGAGIQAAQTVADKGVGVVITGNVGPNATQTLGAANIKIVTGASGTVRDAIEQYKSGGLQQTEIPTAPAYSGMDSSAVAGIGGGRGMGRGGGRGGGGRRGGGRGMGMGMGIGAQTIYMPPEQPLPAQTKDEQIQALESQMKDIKARLDELKK